MKTLLLTAIILTGCAQLQTQQGQAVLATSGTIASAAVNAAATHYGGPVAGQLASAGLNALGSVMQGYVGQPVPPKIVQASPGVSGVGKAILSYVSNSPVVQADVNKVFQAAALALAAGH